MNINLTAYVKDFNRFIHSKIQHKEQKIFLHYFSSEEILINNQEIYLEIYAKQDVKISKEGSNVKAVGTSFCNWWKF